MTAPHVVSIDDALELVVDGTDDVHDVDLFFTTTFYALHRPAAHHARRFALRERESSRVIGVASFLSARDGEFASPWRGSYGGFSAANGAVLSMSDCDAFVNASVQQLEAAGATHVEIVLPPLAYHEADTSRWINVLLRTGFSLANHELNQAITVTGAFVERLDRGNRRQLAKAQGHGLRARRLAAPELRAAYDVVDENRRKKGHALSMTWPAVEAMHDTFPDHVLAFGVHRHDDTMIAAAICLRVNVRTLYVFYWGEIAGVETLSPVTLLASEIYHYCAAQRITLLDLGTSSIRGVPNAGVMRYKEHLGATESLKLTLTRTTLGAVAPPVGGAAS